MTWNMKSRKLYDFEKWYTGLGEYFGDFFLMQNEILSVVTAQETVVLPKKTCHHREGIHLLKESSLGVDTNFSPGLLLLFLLLYVLVYVY